MNRAFAWARETNSGKIVGVIQKFWSSGKSFLTYDNQAFWIKYSDWKIFYENSVSLPSCFTTEKSLSKIFLHINFYLSTVCQNICRTFYNKLNTKYRWKKYFVVSFCTWHNTWMQDRMCGYNWYSLQQTVFFLFFFFLKNYVFDVLELYLKLLLRLTVSAGKINACKLHPFLETKILARCCFI